MNDYDLMRMSDSLDEKIDLSEFTCEQIENLAKSKKFKDDYFDFYDDIKTHTKKKQDW